MTSCTPPPPTSTLSLACFLAAVFQYQIRDPPFLFILLYVQMLHQTGIMLSLLCTRGVTEIDDAHRVCMYPVEKGSRSCWH